MANTGSLLLNRQWVEQHALRFSPDFIQDDTVFSMDAMQQGGTIIFCANAAAKTHIPSERVTLCWALEKCLRNGVTRAAATKRYTMLPVTTAIIVYRACTLFLFAGIALILACMGARPWIRSAEHIAMATGWLIGIVGNKKLLTAPY